MMLEVLKDRFLASEEKEAMVWCGKTVTYRELLAAWNNAEGFLKENRVTKGSVVALEADFSPRSVSFLLALIQHECTIVPLTESVAAKREEFIQIAEVERVITIRSDDSVTCELTGNSVSHPILVGLRQVAHPALVLFSSGSTGKSKGAVHDFLPLLEKFVPPRQSKRMISFLLFDHIGGVNTLFYCLYNAGTLVTLSDRSPREILHTIASHRVQILPTSPTFLNLLLLSHEWKNYDLSSLELVTYGTEPMPASTLQAISQALPHVKFQQTYGLSELGILRSKSKSSDSLWMKVGGEGFETRVVAGLLEIKARSAMLGYLNAPSPFTEDGWFKTGDAVEVDGEWIRVLGRKSELINVGGEKVFPQEVENVLQMMEGVEQVVVSGEPNAITGQMVKATVKITTTDTAETFRKRMRAFCKDRLAAFKIPQKIVIDTNDLFSSRFKKARQS